MSLILRPAEPRDYETIALWIPDAEACRRWAGPKLPYPFAASELPRLLHVAGARAFCLAEGGGPPLGFGQFWAPRPATAHLARILIAPSARGRGLGRALCRSLIAQAVETTGAREITLRVFRDNQAAVALYSGLGFAVAEAGSSSEIWSMKLLREHHRGAGG